MSARGADRKNRIWPALFLMLCCAVLAALGFAALVSTAYAETQTGPLVLELKLNGAVEPILATYIDEG
ncbi:MAG TPA: hypothetical protein VJ255_18700, partial [Candidatus Acidoferrum sp.]|nr:hypothetical protein [Candidatus Acidoferrum sp.]